MTRSQLCAPEHLRGQRPFWRGGEQRFLQLPSCISSYFHSGGRPEGNNSVESNPLAIVWCAEKGAAVAEARETGSRLRCRRHCLPELSNVQTTEGETGQVGSR